MAPAIWPLIALSASMMAWIGLGLPGSAVVAGGAVVATGNGVPAFASQRMIFILQTQSFTAQGRLPKHYIAKTLIYKKGAVWNRKRSAQGVGANFDRIV